MIITIDGPAGSGKTTLAKALKDEINKRDSSLNFEVLDTGAMFRAATLYLTENFKDIELLPYEIEKEEYTKELSDLKEVLSSFKLDILKDAEGNKYILNSKDVSLDLRDMSKMKYLSEVSSTKEVRQMLLKIQRKYAEGRNIVVEGRDTGSVVFENAEYKFFLTADVKIRALRRYKQENDSDEDLKLESVLNDEKYLEVLNSIKKRDKKDTERKIAPLKVPVGAYVIDNSNMSVYETIEYILDIILN